MTEKQRLHIRVLRSQIANLQRRHDQFWRQAVDNGWTKDDAFKRQLMGYQHDVSSSIHNVEATLTALSVSRSKETEDLRNDED